VLAPQIILDDKTAKPQWQVCPECLELSKELTLQACYEIENYYSELAVVFSGKSGFHIHVLDFDYRDWVNYREKDPLWCHSASRFKFTKFLQPATHVFDRVHFTVSCDPLRLVTVPNTLNASTGLVCRFVGDRKDMEKQTILNLLEKSKCLNEIYGYPEPFVGCDKLR
jgi:DNA primase catalytic subunit